MDLGGVEIYRGETPAGMRNSGAIQVGFRENHAGAPGPSEGTWVDALEVRALEPLLGLGIVR